MKKTAALLLTLLTAALIQAAQTLTFAWSGDRCRGMKPLSAGVDFEAVSRVSLKVDVTLTGTFSDSFNHLIATVGSRVPTRNETGGLYGKADLLLYPAKPATPQGEGLGLHAGSFWSPVNPAQTRGKQSVTLNFVREGGAFVLSADGLGGAGRKAERVASVALQPTDGVVFGPAAGTAPFVIDGAAATVTVGPTRAPVPGPLDRRPLYEPDGLQFPVATPSADFGCRLVPVSARRRYGRDRLSGEPPREAAVALSGWKGERVSAQLLVESPEGFDELTVAPCVLTDADGRTLPVRIDIVRYTRAEAYLSADILDGTAQTRFRGVVRPLWITADIPHGATAPFRGTLTVRVNGRPLTAALTVTPEAFTLPAPRDWKCHFDLWQHPDAVARWHGVPLWSDEHFMHLRTAMRPLAEAGQKTITATLIDEAWDHQTYDDFGSMVKITRKADGTYAYDYRIFDRWVTFMSEEMGMKKARIHCYSMLPWSLAFAVFDEAQGRTVRIKAHPGSRAYTDFWGPYLRDFVKHLRAKGWLERTRIAVDERTDALLLPVLKLLETYAPELKLATAFDKNTDLQERFDDISYKMALCGDLTQEMIAARTAAGKKTTFYVCIDVQTDIPNTYLLSDLAESEWLLPMAAAYHMSGFLRWAYQSWPRNPFYTNDFHSNEGPWGRWRPGDTNLIYPGGRPSLRFEALRNGIETFEKIRILRETAAERHLPQAIEPLERVLREHFSVRTGLTAGTHEAALRALDGALRACAERLAR